MSIENPRQEADTPSAPDFRWLHNHGLFRVDPDGTIYQLVDHNVEPFETAIEWTSLPADAVKLGPVVDDADAAVERAECWEEGRAHGAATKYAAQVAAEQARDTAYAERDALRAEIRRVVTGVADLPSHVGRRLLAILDREPGREEPAPVKYAEHERAVLEEVDRRDEAEEWADKLAAALAPADVIGEHSSTNNPWSNALEYAAGRAVPHGEPESYRDRIAREFGESDAFDDDHEALNELNPVDEEGSPSAIAAEELAALTRPKAGAARTLINLTLPDHIDGDQLDESYRSSTVLRLRCTKHALGPVTSGWINRGDTHLIRAFLRDHAHGHVVEQQPAQDSGESKQSTPCGRPDADCGMRGGSAHCGGCRG